MYKNTLSTIAPRYLAVPGFALACTLLLTPLGSLSYAQTDIGECQSSTSDADGDGWGWENGGSCIVSTGTSATVSGICENANSDPDGDGWGWENNASCRIPDTGGESTDAQPSGTCSSAAADPDGDGWGWENNQSCVVNADNSGTGTGTGTGTTTTTDGTATPGIAFTCNEIATKFVTRGSANANLADPEVSAVCADDSVSVTANGIPDFPYIATSPGNPTATIVTYTFPATPVPADANTDIPIVGSIGIAINGVPIYGPTEGPGGDVLARPGGFNECGGHNGPTGYHYHIMDVTGSDYCLFTEADVSPDPTLFGYALDGYPIYTGNTQYASSWFLEDESLFATDTWSAHSYSAGSGDLDECNGRTDENGNYAYYTTDTFPYILGCFRGVVELAVMEGPRGPE